MEKMALKIKGVELILNEYQAQFLKDKSGKIISICFPIEGFYNFVEDVEDTAYFKGYDTSESDKNSVTHEEIIEEMELSPERLKEIRKEPGLTQAEFGEKIGYAAGPIRNMETGQQSISNRATMAVDNLKRA